MDEPTTEPLQKPIADLPIDAEFDTLEHLEANYKAQHLPEIKWHQNMAIQMLYSTLLFAVITFIIVELLVLFSDNLGEFIRSRFIFTAHVTDNVLLHSANRLRVESESLPANEKFRAVELSQNLENAANELDEAGKFTLKSRTKSAPTWLQMAIAEYARQNRLGAYNNRILQYISSVSNSINVPEVNTAWSSHFVNWILQKANITGTNHAEARSWLNWGQPITKLQHGAIAVFKSEWAHKPDMVGFFLLETKNYDIMLAGDVLSTIGIIAFEKTKLLGYRWPNEPLK